MAVPALRVEIITRDFNRMLEQLALIDPRIEFATVVKGVAGRVIQGALNRTKAADAGKIKARAENRKYFTMDGKAYNLENRYPDEVWNRIAQLTQDSLAYKLAARGLSKKSWAHLGNQIGTPTKAPAYVMAANYKGASHPENADSVESGTSMDYALTIINSSPIVQFASGERALLAAMAGETRRFEVLMSKRAFRSVESRAKAYPGIFVRETLAA